MLLKNEVIIAVQELVSENVVTVTVAGQADNSDEAAAAESADEQLPEPSPYDNFSTMGHESESDMPSLDD